MLSPMTGSDELWLPLVDEPIGQIVDGVLESDPAVARLVDSPRKLLAFKTFAYIRVGLVLGQLLVESDERQDEGSSWVDDLLRDPAHRDAVTREVRAVAEEIAADPGYADEEPIGPDAAARERFREFARKQLS
jgi:hypothetical protein